MVSNDFELYILNLPEILIGMTSNHSQRTAQWRQSTNEKPTQEAEGGWGGGAGGGGGGGGGRKVEEMGIWMGEEMGRSVPMGKLGCVHDV